MDLNPGGFDPPSPEQLAMWARRSAPPENEAPGAVPFAGVLGRTDDIAVLLVGATVYSTGVRLDVAIRARNTDAGGDLFGSVGGHLGGANRLLLGVEYADGRVATNSSTPDWPPVVRPDDEASLQMMGGGGGARSVDVSLFLCPVPPAGPLTIMCAWPEREVDETRTVLDASAITAAAAQVVELWPAEPEEPWRRDPPAPPDVPDDSWFGRALRPDRSA